MPTAVRISAVSAIGICLGVMSAALIAQQPGPETVEAHVKAAEVAAGQEHAAMFHRLCDPPAARGAGGGRGGRRGGGPGGGAPPERVVPDRAVWYHEPVKVFDN